MGPEAAEDILVAMFRCATRTTFTGDASRSLDLMWLARYGELKAHLEANGGEYPKRGDAAVLGRWINPQRTRYRNERLSPQRIAGLNKLPGWTWQGMFKTSAETDDADFENADEIVIELDDYDEDITSV